jgi:predicted nucleic acid-binding protein
VVDANVVLAAATTDAGFESYAAEALVAPWLMWSEARSALREAVWRGEIAEDEGLLYLSRLATAGIEPRQDAGVGSEAWRIARELGWAKTYDAEYLALASLLGCRFVTLDARLYRRTAHLGFVVSPTEL